jgi:hypothetical protein
VRCVRRGEKLLNMFLLQAKISTRGMCVGANAAPRRPVARDEREGLYRDQRS